MKMTEDYTIFRNVIGNREISQSHAEKLARAIDRKNLLRFFPVLVNENMEVIDGQHRLVAAAKVQVPIHYEVVKGLHLEDIMSINTNSRSWSIYDFISAYRKLDSPDYEELWAFMQEYKMSASISAALLAGHRAFSAGGGSLGRSIKAGTFHAVSPILAKDVAEQANELRRYCDFEPQKEREFMHCMVELHRNETFDFTRLIDKLKASSQKLTRRPSSKYYLLEIEEAYNFNAKVAIELYKSTQVA